MSQPSPIVVPISAGELVDKLTILRIKCERIADSGKLANVRRELSELEAVAQTVLSTSERLTELTDELTSVNAALWQVEDDLRQCEAGQRFDEQFIELARSVYHLNDRRAALKRSINALVGSPLVEEKLHPAYRGRA